MVEDHWVHSVPVVTLDTQDPRVACLVVDQRYSRGFRKGAACMAPSDTGTEIPPALEADEIARRHEPCPAHLIQVKQFARFCKGLTLSVLKPKSYREMGMDPCAHLNSAQIARNTIRRCRVGGEELVGPTFKMGRKRHVKNLVNGLLRQIHPDRFPSGCIRRSLEIGVRCLPKGETG